VRSAWEYDARLKAHRLLVDETSGTVPSLRAMTAAHFLPAFAIARLAHLT
jgi:hypothetical protein